jgi:hypothetical protein
MRDKIRHYFGEQSGSVYLQAPTSRIRRKIFTPDLAIRRSTMPKYYFGWCEARENDGYFAAVIGM